MVSATYKLFGRCVKLFTGQKFPEEPEAEPFTLDDFEEAKSRYSALTERFNLLAGRYSNCVQIMKCLDYAERVICEIEFNRREIDRIVEAPDAARRKRVEDYFIENSPFHDMMSDVFRRLDKTLDLLSEPIEQSANPTLPHFKNLMKMSDLDYVIEGAIQVRESEEEMVKMIEEALESANISKEAQKYLTKNELLRQAILVSPPKD
ncbi:MAG TPA: hypothetical protein VJA47_01190 [archaeon]|nr:hypothetical protein [archaeon]